MRGMVYLYSAHFLSTAAPRSVLLLSLRKSKSTSRVVILPSKPLAYSAAAPAAGSFVQRSPAHNQNLARDPWSSPPTAAELASLDLVYVNDRVIAMGFPVDKRPPSAVMGAGGDAGGASPPTRPTSVGVRAGNDMDLVAALLRSRHSGHYMVWNVSEEGYDYSLFQDQVGWWV